MIAILGGLGAASLWALATICSARSGRLIGASSTVAWVMVVGLVVLLPPAIASGPPPPLDPRLAGFALVSGLSNVLGLFLVYRAVSIGKVGVASAVTSTEGAVAAIISILLGEPLTAAAAVVLAVIAAGVAVVALVPEDAVAEGELEAGVATEAVRHGRQLDPSDALRAVVYAALAALSFGFGLYTTAQLGLVFALPYAVLPARVTGTLLLFIPLLATGRLRMTRAALPFAVTIGICEAVGTMSYAAGARESVAIAAVLASQFAAIAAVAAYFLFRERLTLHQRSGVIVIALGVAVLSAIRA